MEIDLQQWQASIQYGNDYCRVLSGEDTKPLAEYPDKSDDSVVQYVFDTLDSEKLYNEYLYDNAQSILDSWLVEEISASDARKQLLALFADHYDFGC